MRQQEQTDYARIEKAIAFIRARFQEQPSLEDMAAAVHLSPFHFQRIFTAWAGVSPKKFIQYLSLEYAKGLLQAPGATLLDTAYRTGLSGTSRLHDLFVRIEGMTPGIYKSGGAGLVINYTFAQTPFGQVIVASTDKGICHMFFETCREKALNDLKERFPHAVYHQKADAFQKDALSIFQKDGNVLETVKLHLSGTPFQIKVWNSLLRIPAGSLRTYGDIAKEIGSPGASRAVGRAIGANPVAFLIPCHRVIQSSGKTGGYMWGETRKSAIIGWEAARTDNK